MQVVWEQVQRKERSLWMNECVCVNVCLYECVFVWMCVCVNVCLYECVCVNVCLWMCVCMNVCLCECMSVWMCLCECVFCVKCVFVWMCVCVSSWVAGLTLRRLALCYFNISRPLRLKQYSAVIDFCNGSRLFNGCPTPCFGDHRLLFCGGQKQT